MVSCCPKKDQQEDNLMHNPSQDINDMKEGLGEMNFWTFFHKITYGHIYLLLDRRHHNHKGKACLEQFS